MKKNSLADEPFSYQLLKNESIHIFYHTRRVTVVNGAHAKKLGKKLERCSGVELQKALAKATGNFKRGNE
ncbi:hypothetical protein KQI52_16695 [bacterium]|nr:hypothetical protein [bacterium]